MPCSKACTWPHIHDSIRAFHKCSTRCLSPADRGTHINAGHQGQPCFRSGTRGSLLNLRNNQVSSAIQRPHLGMRGRGGIHHDFHWVWLLREKELPRKFLTNGDLLPHTRSSGSYCSQFWKPLGLYKWHLCYLFLWSQHPLSSSKILQLYFRFFLKSGKSIQFIWWEKCLTKVKDLITTRHHVHCQRTLISQGFPQTCFELTGSVTNTSPHGPCYHRARREWFSLKIYLLLHHSNRGTQAVWCASKQTALYPSSA